MRNCTLRNDDEIIDDVIETIRNIATEAITAPVVFKTPYDKNVFSKRTAEQFYFHLSERAKDFGYAIAYQPGERPNSEEIIVTMTKDGIKQVGTMTLEGEARETSAYAYNKLFTGKMVRPPLHDSVYINVLLLIAIALTKMTNEVAYGRIIEAPSYELVPITEIPSKVLLDEVLLFLSKYA